MSTIEKSVMVPTARGREAGYTDSVGPFDTYDQAREWREDNGLIGLYSQKYKAFPAVSSPQDFVKPEPRYKGAVYEIRTSKSDYRVTVEKLNGAGRTKAEMVFPLRTVLGQAMDNTPDEYIKA